VKSVDVAALGGNLESTARRVRYEFFHELTAEVNAAWIATGHTADDQAETVLHRIVRGTGIQGLRGIAACGFAGELPAKPQAAILRPLLTVTRGDIITYLAELGQPFREDSSNADPRFTRNRIRHELLPLLRSFNPDVVTALARLAEHANDAHVIITEKAAEVLAKAERPRVGNVIILDVADLGTSRAVVRSVLRLVWEREAWSQDQMDAEAWDRACAVACRDLPACDFPGGITMRHTGRVVQLGARK
jgi:tRNA(Ile)-lysidine synthase